jgi:imidazolonepropionase-like amidohydrolase
VDAAEVVFPATRFATWCIVAIAALLSTEVTCAESKQLALVGGMLLDRTGGAPVRHAAILIEGNRILAAGPATDVRIPAGTPVIDTSGATMLPGLIELRAHLLLVGHGDIGNWFAWLEKHEAEYSAETVMALSARQLLSAGITSAVDLGAPLRESVSVRDRINRGEIPGPRLSVSGPWLIPNAAIFPRKYQRIVSTPEEAARATEANIRGGADVIKAQGGLTLAQYQAIVATAHKFHIKVHAHLYEEQAVRDAFDAGVDVLQHAGSAGTAPYDPALVRAIADSGRPVVPTAAHRVWVLPATREFPERLDDPELKRQFPADMWAELQNSFRDFSNLDYFKNHSREESYGDDSIRQWILSGAVIGMGSDNGSPLNFHTDALWREAKVFVDHGLPAARTIAALTSVGARILGKEKDLGTIGPGKLADITVVRGNPLFDITSLSSVAVVVKDGIAYRNAQPVNLRALPRANR